MGARLHLTFLVLSYSSSVPERAFNQSLLFISIILITDLNIFEAVQGPDVVEGEKYKKDIPMILVSVPHDEEKPNTTGWEKSYPHFKFRSDFQLTWLSSPSTIREAVKVEKKCNNYYTFSTCVWGGGSIITTLL